MTDTPDHIEREVEENRARVESTLDALKERMSVNQLVDDLAHFVGVEDVRGIMHTAGRQVRDNPVALGMIGLGLAWLAFGGGSSSGRRSAHDDDWDDRRPDWSGSSTYDPYGGSDYRDDRREGVFSKVKHAVGDAAESVGQAVHSAGEKVSDTFSGTRERASHMREDLHDRAGRLREDTYHRAGQWRDELSSRSGRIGERAGEWAHRASSGAHQVRDSMAYRMEQQPLLVGAAAVALGAVIGAAMPRTRTEDRWMGRTRDQLWDEARASSAELRERAMQAARHTYDAAVDAARDEGLVPEKGETISSKLGRVAEAAAAEAKAQVEPVLHPSEGKSPEQVSGMSGKTGAGSSSTGTGSTGSASTGSTGTSAGTFGTGSTGTGGSSGTGASGSGSSSDPTRPSKVL
ncbi:DUF3618 domain-containing protein [Cereibacter sphaeroides]|uniref:DUF3618 domain-containing protein n=1 Tax=Cereibacter sphaeroides TaxID=1063 RepID=UPI001F22C6CE|nr:DUF3618 domain-containing protein [Cereibacter sphaeroides]MCE6952137.1 DUF3618 domain-containing protein [Cereibacter sphaeroides]